VTHADFVAALGRGEVRAEFDKAGAARFLSARLLLPLVMLPVLGAGVALALTGWIYTGLIVIAGGIIGPRLVKRAAPRFLLQMALEDPRVYDELTQAAVLRVTARQ